MSINTENVYDVQKDPWYSPKTVVEKFQALGAEYGENILKPEFKKAEEMFIASVTLLGIYENNQEENWLQINQQSASPDIMAAKQTVRSGELIRLEIMQMEITIMEEHFPNNDLVEFLLKTKLSPKKAYSETMLIVCLVNRDIEIKVEEISEKLKSIAPKTAIFIVGRQGDPKHFVLFSPYPTLTKEISFDVIETAKKMKLTDKTRFKRGTSTTISYQNTHTEPVDIYKMFGLNEELIKSKYNKPEKVE